MSMFIGEALDGEGNEIAHIDLLIGSKDGPVGVAFANALARQSEGHSNLLAVLTPTLQNPSGTVLAERRRQAGDGHDHEGHDQGCQAGGADVWPRPGRGRQGRCRQRG